MATATLSLTATLDGKKQTVSHTGDLDDAQIPYFVAACKANAGQIQSTNPDGTPQVDANKMAVMRDLTDAEAFEWYASRVAAQAVALTTQYIREQAIQQALAAIPTVAITQTV